MLHHGALGNPGFVALIILCITASAISQSLPTTLTPTRIVNTTLTHPTQMSISPQGDRFAIADPYANSIQIFDNRGAELWNTGKNLTLSRPHGLVMTGSGTILFSQLDAIGLFLASEDQPSMVTPIPDSLGLPSPKTRIKKIYQLQNQSFLLLTEYPTHLLTVDQSWKKIVPLINAGSGRGMLNSPTSCVELPGSRIAVTCGGDFPVQFFDAKGRFLNVADWNSSTPRKSWNASGSALDQRSRLWVADITNAQFRLYDLTGTLLGTRGFQNPLMRPVDLGILSDGQLVVVNDNGSIHFYEVNQE